VRWLWNGVALWRLSSSGSNVKRKVSYSQGDSPVVASLDDLLGDNKGCLTIRIAVSTRESKD